MNKKYDAIVVFGRGIGQDGALPESVEAYMKKCAELFEFGTSQHIVMCGKWSYSLDYTPPCSEAEAMARLAEKLGVQASAILKEDQSYTMVSNCYFLKKDILEPRGWRRILLVSMHPIHTRAMFNLEMVLGQNYSIDVSLVDYRFPEPKNTELEEEELSKMKYVRDFFKPFAPGDHEAIFKASEEDLNKNYKGKQKSTEVA